MAALCYFICLILTLQELIMFRCIHGMGCQCECNALMYCPHPPRENTTTTTKSMRYSRLFIITGAWSLKLVLYAAIPCQRGLEYTAVNAMICRTTV